MKTLFSICGALILGAASLFAADPVPAFPGAEGYGAWTTGGRGGRVIAVTNLNDSGPGSFREACQERGPRIIVFRVGGTIELERRIEFKEGDVTVAGQTAPGGGIALKNHGMKIGVNNVILRHLRLRPSDSAGKELDGLSCGGQKNIIVDHCSISWSTDEAASLYGNQDTTVQWCLISESLYASAHSSGSHGFGGIWGGVRSSFHHNLLAHHTSRNPRFSPREQPIDLRNNVIYNWGYNTAYGGEESAGNMVANYYKPGPATQLKVIDRIFDGSGKGGKWFIEGNRMVGAPDLDADNWQGGVQTPWATEKEMRLTQSVPAAYVTTQTAEEAYELVLKDAGATLPIRDGLDQRIVEEVRTGTARFGKSFYSGVNGIIDTAADVGGWPVLANGEAPTDGDRDGMPDAWEAQHKLNPQDASDGPLDADKDGYTNVEEFLNQTNPQEFKDYRIPKELPVQKVEPKQPAKFWRRTIVVGTAPGCHFQDLQAALDAAPADRNEVFFIDVLPGEYRGNFTVPASKPHLYIRGGDSAETILVSENEKPALHVPGSQVSFRDLILRNTGGGPALVSEGDRVFFRECHFTSEGTAVRVDEGRVLFSKGRIQGGDGMIAGSATALFDRCEINSLQNGRISAPTTPADQPAGLVFRGCELSAEPEATEVYLGGVDEGAGFAAFLSMDLPGFISPSGWNGNAAQARLMEYKTTGFGAVPDARVIWAREIGSRDADQLDDKILFAGWNPEARALPPGTPPAKDKPSAPETLRIAGGNGHAALRWSPVKDAAFYVIRRADGPDAPLKSIVSDRRETHWTDRTVVNGTAYRYVVHSVNAAGESGPSAIATVTPAGEGLPAPWAVATLGDPSKPAAASLERGVLTLPAGTPYAYQAWAGDGEIVTHLSQPGSGGGIVVCNGPGSPIPYVIVGSIDGAGHFDWGAQGAKKPDAKKLKGFPAPCWIKLSRQGTAFRGHISLDGANWTLVGEAEVPPFDGPVLVGLTGPMRDGKADAASFDGLAFPAVPKVVEKPKEEGGK